MADEAKVSEAVGMAVEMEKKGAAFYTDVAAKMSSPFAKSRFLSIAQDEKRHERIFREMAAKAGVTPADLDQMDQEGPIARIQGIFRELGRQVSEELNADDDQVKALDIAIDMEKDAYKFYSETAEACADPQEKKMLLKIANEENDHYRIFDDTRLYLTNQEEWNIKEEKPVIDGG